MDNAHNIANIDKQISDSYELILKSIQNNLDDDMFIKYISGEDYIAQINNKKLQNIKPIYKKYIYLNTLEYETTSFSKVSLMQNILYERFENYATTQHMRKYDIYKNVRYYLRYHKIFDILKKLNMDIKKIDIVIIHFSNCMLKTELDTIALKKIKKKNKY